MDDLKPENNDRIQSFWNRVMTKGDYPVGITISKDIADRIRDLQDIRDEIISEGTDEGGDPEDFQQAKEVDQVISDLRGEVLGEPEDIESLFPKADDEDATLYAA